MALFFITFLILRGPVQGRKREGAKAPFPAIRFSFPPTGPASFFKGAIPKPLQRPNAGHPSFVPRHDDRHHRGHCPLCENRISATPRARTSDNLCGWTHPRGGKKRRKRGSIDRSQPVRRESEGQKRVGRNGQEAPQQWPPESGNWTNRMVSFTCSTSRSPLLVLSLSLSATYAQRDYFTHRLDPASVPAFNLLRYPRMCAE